MAHAVAHGVALAVTHAVEHVVHEVRAVDQPSTVRLSLGVYAKTLSLRYLGRDGNVLRPLRRVFPSFQQLHSPRESLRPLKQTHVALGRLRKIT